MKRPSQTAIVLAGLFLLVRNGWRAARFWWTWGTFGRCQWCGRLGVLDRSEHMHEHCWLALK